MSLTAWQFRSSCSAFLVDDGVVLCSVFYCNRRKGGKKCKQYFNETDIGPTLYSPQNTLSEVTYYYLGRNFCFCGIGLPSSKQVPF